MPEQKSHKTSPRSQQKKLAILQHALACFVQHGVAGTTIDMIREASQTSVGSLYHHFGNKEAIAGALYIEGLREFAVLVKKYLQELSNKDVINPQQAQTGIKALVYANVDWITQQPDWARYVFQHRGHVSGESESHLKGDQQHFNSFIDVWFKPFIKQGIIKNYPLPLLNSFITGPVHNYARNWLAGRVDVPLSDYREELAEAAWQSVKE